MRRQRIGSKKPSYGCRPDHMHPLLLVALAYLPPSLICYAAYALDKSAARRQGRRMPERTLHLLALLGGWPGAWIAQRRLRHKTNKPRFLLVFWLTVLLNVAAVTTWAASSLRP